MSFNAGWRGFEIIMENYDEDLAGAIRNGFDRGHSFDQIRASLQNAGYPSDRIEVAIQKSPEYISTIQNSNKILQNQVKRLPIPQIIKKSKLSTAKIVYILIFLLLLTIVGGVVLWIFRDSLMNIIK